MRQWLVSRRGTLPSQEKKRGKEGNKLSRSCSPDWEEMHVPCTHGLVVIADPLHVYSRDNPQMLNKVPYDCCVKTVYSSTQLLS